MKLKTLLLCTVILISNIINAQNFSSEKRGAAAGNDTRIAVKLNGLLFIGIINPAVEFRVLPKATVQLEGMGSFYHKNFLGTGRPFVLGATWAEFRYYPKKAFDGFYCAPNIGWGVYRLNKGIVPGYHDTYPKTYFQMGSNIMAGLTVGYQFNIGRHWSLEASWSAGWQGSTYQGFDTADQSMYTDTNGSGEWLPMYKCGLLVGYRF